MPARQRRPVFDDVTGGPKNSLFVEMSRYIVIRTQNIKVAGAHPFDHEVDGLFGSPGARRLLATSPRGEAGEHKAGDEQMRAYARTRSVTKLMLQCLGK